MGQACPFRFLHKGRTFCAVAVRERRFTTARVEQGTCAECPVPGMLSEHPCLHLDLGVEIDEYGPRAQVVFTYTACRATVEELKRMDQCGEGRCGLWRPAEEKEWEALRRRAQRRRQALEARLDMPEKR